MCLLINTLAPQTLVSMNSFLSQYYNDAWNIVLLKPFLINKKIIYYGTKLWKFLVYMDNLTSKSNRSYSKIWSTICLWLNTIVFWTSLQHYNLSIENLIFCLRYDLTRSQTSRLKKKKTYFELLDSFVLVHTKPTIFYWSIYWNPWCVTNKI
jgi:hypothetical protein